MKLQDLNLEKLHHAYIIFSPVSHFASVEREISEKMSENLEDSLDSAPVSTSRGSADFIKFSYKSMGVDDVRSIGDFNSRVEIGRRKIAIISAETITVPAQNALLKIIEEPNHKTHFFIIVPAKSQILPTILSRTSELNVEDKEFNDELQKEVANFLKHSPADRLVIVKEMLAFLEKEKMTRGQICEFISETVKMAHENNRKTGKKFSKNQLSSILSIEQFMRDQASSMKLCLEYLSLTI